MKINLIKIAVKGDLYAFVEIKG